ncbi:hypothetical protein [Aquipuribacter nitratireducens]|uniref:Glycosyltransferase RgtA/B/C/D-like domain-containing protein n=1 Tax=Aquipuribacter nitratireducens TaxID=650104 RepID=A0ABW0GLI3_9MICO
MRTGAALVALGVLVAVVAGLGVTARATYGAQLTADEPQYLLTAVSLARDGDLDIADELREEVWRDFHAADLPEQTRERPDGSRLSPHDPLLPVLLVPAVRVADATGLPAWVLARTTLALLAGLAASLTAWVAVRRLAVPVVPALVVTASFALSPPLVVYATQLYPELPAALAVVTALGCLLGRPRRGAAVALGLVVVALPWLAVKYALVAAVLAGAALWWLRRDRPALALWAVGVGLAGLHWLWFHLAVYGGLTAYAAGDYFEGGSVSATGPDPAYLARTQRLVGLLLDRDFGLLPWAPVFLLVPLVVAWALRRRGPGHPLLLAVLAAGWVVATWVAQTMHGWWWPGRQLVVVLPALVLLAAAWVAAGRGRVRPGVTAALGVLGLGAFLTLAVATSTGVHTLVVDFSRTPWPVYRALRPLLPDLTTPGPATVALVAAWTLGLLALAVVGWRSGRRSPRQPR